ncbi:MAG TPA: hypothetical protein DIC22_12220 [Chitinophagaceae bacterium]|nr:hypothetical protein [Chitinophagaceae bacterium]
MWKSIKKEIRVNKNTVHSYQTLYRQGFYHDTPKPFTGKGFTKPAAYPLCSLTRCISLKPLSVLNYIRSAGTLKVLKKRKSRYICRYKILHYEQSRFNFQNCR